MKIKKTLLVAILASSIFAGSSAQAYSRGCNLALNHLAAVISFYSSGKHMSGEGAAAIADAQNQVTLQCEAEVIGLEP